MRFIITLWIAKLVACIVNLVDKQRGSNYSGKIAVKLMPNFVSCFKKIDYNKVIFITGTNGKSTTTNLVYHTLTSAGKSVAANVEGANMLPGVATTLVKNSTLLGSFNNEYLVLEVDERSFPIIRKQLPARHMGITNLQKDQVQRNGDPDFILRKFRGAVGKDMTLYLNNEEPRSRSLEDYAGAAVHFSVDKNSRTYTVDDFYAVTLPCPKCGHPIAYDCYHLASIGPFRCTGCDYTSLEAPQVRIENVDFENNSFVCNGSTWTVPYNNPFYIYNFAMCIAICRIAGLTDAQIQNGFSTFKNPASHIDSYQFRGKQVYYLRGKQENPEALQSQLDIIAADPRKKAVLVGMHAVADFFPYYSGSFYFFDCHFAPIVESNVERFVAFSSTVAGDLASRMLLAGADPQRLSIFDTDDLDTVFQSLQDLDAEVIYMLTNTKHAKQIKQYLAQGGRDNA